NPRTRVRIARVRFLDLLFSRLLTGWAGALGGGCPLDQVQAAVLGRSRHIDGIRFLRVALCGCAPRFLTDSPRNFAEPAFRVRPGDPLLNATVTAFFLRSSVPYFGHLPLSVAIGKQRGFMRFNRVVRFSFAALLRFHDGIEAALDA